MGGGWPLGGGFSADVDKTAWLGLVTRGGVFLQFRFCGGGGGGHMI